MPGFIIRRVEPSATEIFPYPTDPASKRSITRPSLTSRPVAAQNVPSPFAAARRASRSAANSLRAAALRDLRSRRRSRPGETRTELCSRPSCQPVTATDHPQRPCPRSPGVPESRASRR